MDHMIDMADADPAVMRFRMEKEQERKALRDKLAMAALPRIIADYGGGIQAHVKLAYEYADAMMKEREDE